ncbi:MAG: signal peptidase II [Woeseia sp.]
MEVTDSNDSGRTPTYGIWISIAVLVVTFDQLTKWAILEWVPLYSKIPINPFLNITHHENTGAAFSFLANQPGWQRWFFIGLGMIVSAVIAVWLWRLRRSGKTVLSAGLALVLGGALGNVIDRIRLGHVIDFIQVLFGSWPFPSFNVADAAITIGAGLLIIDALFLSERHAPEPPKEDKTGD